MSNCVSATIISGVGLPCLDFPNVFMFFSKRYGCLICYIALLMASVEHNVVVIVVVVVVVVVVVIDVVVPSKQPISTSIAAR